jgi:hypothetical protein
MITNFFIAATLQNLCLVASKRPEENEEALLKIKELHTCEALLIISRE